MPFYKTLIVNNLKHLLHHATAYFKIKNRNMNFVKQLLKLPAFIMVDGTEYHLQIFKNGETEMRLAYCILDELPSQDTENFVFLHSFWSDDSFEKALSYCEAFVKHRETNFPKKHGKTQ